MAKIELIIWDFDGVLVDSEFIAGQVRTELLAEIGINMDLDTVLRRFVGLHADQMSAILTNDYGLKDITGFLTEVRKRYLVAFEDRLEALPFTDEILGQLTQPLCIGSNSSTQSITRKLKRSGLDRHFATDKIYVGSMFKNPKPAPDMYLHAAREHGVEPINCLVIEDSVPGTNAAVAAGMPVIGFHGATHCYDGYEAKLTKAGALVTFNDFRKLHDIISSL